MRKFRALAILALLSLSAPVLAQDAGPPDETAVVEAAPAPEAPATPNLDDVKEAVEKGKEVVGSLREGVTREAVAGLVMLMVFLWRRFASGFIIGKLSPWWVGFVTALVAFLATIPAALSMNPFSWPDFLLHGLVTGGEAMIFWQMLGKKVLPKVFGTPKPAGG